MTTVNQKTYKFLKTKVASVDEEAKSVRFCISDDQPDRMDEVVDQKSWDFKNFSSNPIALWIHRGHDAEPEDVIGTWSDFETSTEGGVSKTYATLTLDTDINPKADIIFKQLGRGTLRCVSVGFVPHTLDYVDGQAVLKDNEMLEISVVPIPANPRAVALALKAGEISRKDAGWLMRSMRDEADFIEKQMQTTNSEEPIMDKELVTKMDAVFNAMTAMAKAQTETNEQLVTIAEKSLIAPVEKGAVTDILNADSGWDVSEAKWMAMDQVAEVYYALCEAFFYTATPVSNFPMLLEEAIGLWQQVADGTYGNEEGTGVVAKAAKAVDGERVKSFILSLNRKSASPDKSANDEEKVDDLEEVADNKKQKPETSKTDGPAKGGEDDQPGAEDGQIDDDTELTPELKAELDEAIADTQQA